MLNRELILESLERLGELLKERDMTGEILLTGGAAMCLVHSARGMTMDVDALYKPKQIINILAKQIADEKGLADDWLNDGVKGFLTDNPPIDEFLVLDGLKVLTVAPEYLLAMKLFSARLGSKDLDDIQFLLNKLQVKSIDDAISIIIEHFPEDRILPKTRYILEEFFTEDEDITTL